MYLVDKARIGYAERLEGGFKVVHQLSFGKSEGDNKPKKLKVAGS